MRVMRNENEWRTSYTVGESYRAKSNNRTTQKTAASSVSEDIHYDI
jgi:hypothetical protein